MITTHNKTKRNKAFTLAEVMLAIGIMGIGMVFAACLFPAAIKEGEKSSNALEGAIIADNALAIAKMRISESMLYYPVDLSNPANDRNPGNLNSSLTTCDEFVVINKAEENPITSEPFLGNDLIYPSDKTPIGASNNEQPPFIESVVLIQNRANDRNDFMLIAAACRKMAADNNIVVEDVSISYTKGDEHITLSDSSDASKFFKDGIVIYTNSIHSTVLAKVTGVDGTKVSLNHMLQSSTNSAGVNNYVIVIYENDSSNNPTGNNPVMSIAVNRCPLTE